MHGWEDLPLPIKAVTLRIALMILIVEDDDGTRETFALALRVAGYDVRTAANGRDAVAIMEDEAPSVIFSDLHMPHIDGWTLRRLQQQSPGLAEVPFVVISADIDVEEHGCALEAAAVLPKPVDVRDLLRFAEYYDRSGRD